MRGQALERSNGTCHPGDERTLARVKGVGGLHYQHRIASFSLHECQRYGERHRPSPTRLIDDAAMGWNAPKRVQPPAAMCFGNRQHNLRRLSDAECAVKTAL